MTIKKNREGNPLNLSKNRNVNPHNLPKNREGNPLNLSKNRKGNSLNLSKNQKRNLLNLSKIRKGNPHNLTKNRTGNPLNLSKNRNGNPLNLSKNQNGNPLNLPNDKISGLELLPSPEFLQKYNSVIPGLADRLVAQVEKQTSHRIAQEKKLLNSNICKSLLGLVFGFLISSIGIGGGLYLTFVGFNVIGIVFSSATLVSLVMSFIYGSQYRKKVTHELP